MGARPLYAEDFDTSRFLAMDAKVLLVLTVYIVEVMIPQKG